MKPEELHQLGGSDECGDAIHDHDLVLAGRCHTGAPTVVTWNKKKRELLVACAVCKLEVLRFEIDEPKEVLARASLSNGSCRHCAKDVHEDDHDAVVATHDPVTDQALEELRLDCHRAFFERRGDLGDVGYLIEAIVLHDLLGELRERRDLADKAFVEGGP